MFIITNQILGDDYTSEVATFSDIQKAVKALNKLKEGSSYLNCFSLEREGEQIKCIPYAKKYGMHYKGWISALDDNYPEDYSGEVIRIGQNLFVADDGTVYELDTIGYRQVVNKRK